MVKYITIPILALAMNFMGALFITLSSGLYKGKQRTFFSGERNLVLNHPIIFKIGLLLIVVGFFLQLIFEIVKIYKGYSG